MSQIRYLHIKRFRGISTATWAPRPGINALIGAGDNGKSTLLEAIDLALSPRRTGAFTDTDFHNLDVSEPIEISVTIGALPSSLLDLETYALFLRGWNAVSGLVEPEPGPGLEPVLTVRLVVKGDLDPRWSLYSERAEADDVTRDLRFAERADLAPTRLGAFASHHFSWGPRSVLNRLSDERANASQALAAASREARAASGDTVKDQVAQALKIVQDVSREAGVRGGHDATALLDVHGVSFSGGVIALHDAQGVPLRNLGLGSSRLLVASLQAEASAKAGVVLIDELEHGLEPYRVVRLLHTLGSKEADPKQQVFLTTHSPIAVRELAAHQLTRVRRAPDGTLNIRAIGAGADDQATVRACAEAFLAPNVIVCEGATEIGLMRGLDLYWTGQDRDPMAYFGVAACDGGGANMFARAACFGSLGYRTALLRDSDVPLTPAQASALDAAGVTQFTWSADKSTEQQLYDALPDVALGALLQIAIDHVGREAVEQHLRNADPTISFVDLSNGPYLPAKRSVLGKAAGKGKWFKMVEPAERVGREVVGPHLTASQPALRDVIGVLRSWIEGPSSPAAPSVAPPDDDAGV